MLGFTYVKINKIKLILTNYCVSWRN